MRVKGETGGVLKRGYKRGRYEPIKNHVRVKQLKNPKGVKGDKRSGVLGKVCCGRQSYVRWEACPELTLGSYMSSPGVEAAG